MAGVTDSGYSRIRENPERRFERAGGAKSFRRIRKDFRTALSADSDYSRHSPAFSSRSLFVLRKILANITPEAPRSDGVARRRCRQEWQPCAQFPAAIIFDSAAEIGETPA